MCIYMSVVSGILCDSRTFGGAMQARTVRTSSTLSTLAFGKT
jgi:hypothetical protein